MKTKLFSLLMVLTLSGSLVIAQNTGKAKMSIAVLGGINLQNQNGKAFNGDKLTNELLLGYHAGVNVQIPIVPEFYFQPGLMFLINGSKNSSSESTSTTKLSYLQLPLNFVYKGMLGNGYVMLGFGPYVGYAIGGKVVTEGSSVTLEQKIEFKNVVKDGDPLTVPYYKAFDAGGNIFAGYEMANGIFAQLDTQFGMIKTNSEYSQFPDDKSSVKNTGFGLSLGYRF